LTSDPEAGWEAVSGTPTGFRYWDRLGGCLRRGGELTGLVVPVGNGAGPEADSEDQLDNMGNFEIAAGHFA